MAKCFGSALAIVASTTLVFLAPAAAAGQAPQTVAKAWEPPRTPDGQPDIQGVWEEEAGGADGTNVETGFQTAETLKIQGRTDAQIAARKPVSAIVDTPDGKIPYQPWAEARRQQILSRYGGDVITGKPQSVRDVNPEVLCILGMPRLSYWADFQVVQTPGYVVMSWERTRAYRLIPLDGSPHVSPNVKLHMGDARGSWEGNTLVVHTTNLSDWTWFDSKGTIHTDATSLVERYTFVDPNTMRYQLTVQDPKAFTRPWTMEFTLKRAHAQAEGYELMEYACTEGERALGSILGAEGRR
jgi:hypothetical protein